MNIMKENYEFWNRIVNEFKNAVDKAISERIVNEIFLKAAEKELKKFPKPKEDNPTKTITG